MKQFLALLLTVLMTLSLLTGCGNAVPRQDASASADASDYKIAFITGMGDIHDHSFNEDCYLGVQQFCEQSGAFCKYFMPAGWSNEELLDTIQQAVNEEFDVIVMAGVLFAEPCLEAAKTNPGTLFLALAVTPSDMGAAIIPSNVALLTHKEEQAGFLAGYAAVAEGYRELGFLGGMDVSAVVRFGHGYLQGANKAAADLGISGVHVKYWYSGTFIANDDITAKMDTWYQEGTEIIFACGGAIYESALEAADRNDGKLIGVDMDMSDISPRFITSAVKSLSTSVVLALNAAAANNMHWPNNYAGACQSLGVVENCVGLAMENSRFENFTPEMYRLLYKALMHDSYNVDSNSDPDDHPRTDNIQVDWQYASERCRCKMQRHLFM